MTAEFVRTVAILITLRFTGDVEHVALVEEVEGLLVGLRVGIGLGRPSPSGEAVVHPLPQQRPPPVGDGAERLRPRGVGGRCPVFHHDARVPRAEVGRRARTASAAAHEDVARQREARGRGRLGDDRPEVRIVERRGLVAATDHLALAAAVVAVAGVEAADDREPVHLPGRVGQQFAHVHARHARRDGAERAAGVGAGLRIPALELAHAAVKKDHEHPLASRPHRIGETRRGGEATAEAEAG